MVHRWPHHPPATPHRTLHPHQPSDADAAESITHRRASASPSYTTPRTAAVPMSAAPRVRRPSSTAGTLVKPLAASIHPKPSPPSAPSTTSRYSHVHSTLNTGPNASNTHRPSPYRTADPFPRLSPTTLAALIRAHSDAEESVYALTARRTLPPHPRDEDGVSAIGSVGGEGGVEGGGRGVGLVVGTMDAPSYLLLDVREAGEFAAGHIVGAVSFPAVLVRRDQYPSILVQFVLPPHTPHPASPSLPCPYLTTAPLWFGVTVAQCTQPRGGGVRLERRAFHPSARCGGGHSSHRPRLHRRASADRWHRALVHPIPRAVHGARRCQSGGEGGQQKPARERHCQVHHALRCQHPAVIQL